jgi:septal ring factor EnvC (AmiA/AmiB activator)
MAFPPILALGAPARAVAILVALEVGVSLQPAAAQQTAPVQDRRVELARLQDEIKLSDEVVARLQAQIRALDEDRAKLAADLVATAARTRETEAKADAAEERLSVLAGEEAGLKASLASRKGLLVEVIASLQRMGHHPPPALLVRPEDALEAVRTAMLLGSVLPEMRGQMQALAGDLAKLAGVRKGIVAERDRLKSELGSLAEDRTRIDLLVGERQRILAAQERNLVNEQVRAAALGRDAESLKELIARMESEVAAARRAADAAAAEPGKPVLRPSLAALEDPNRLSPALPFEQAKGLLTAPVTGTALRQFGEDDGNGGSEKGLVIGARPSATVTAPCDGWVVYAGPFRSYGQLLIINAGGGYHVVLAGMERINVGLGQFVLTGEPVAVMGAGEVQLASTAPSAGPQPTLYVEFRKDGVSIDPTPWWANKGEKARG